MVSVMQTQEYTFENIYEPSELPKSIGNKWESVSCLSYKDDRRVFIVRNKDTGERCILKWGRTGSDKADRLRKEYNVLSTLNETFLPKPIGIYEDVEGVSFIRKYIAGKTLKHIVDSRGNLSPQNAADVMLRLCPHVYKLHRHVPPLVHRDIKPENIVETEDGDYIFIDLDTIREYRKGEPSDTVYLGSAQTAAPEQFGFMQTSVRTDVYSLGALFLYLLTGRYTVYCPEWNSLPNAYRSVINKCLAFDPRNRYPSVKVLISDLSCVRRLGIRKYIRNAIISVASAIILLTVILAGLKIRDNRYRTLAVQFANPQIEEAARIALGKEGSEIVTQEELSTITSIILCGDKVFGSWQEHQSYHDDYFAEFNDSLYETEPAELSDLRLFSNLHSLALDNKGISDLTAIKNLPLTRLWVQKNGIEDISSISQMETLTVLNISQNPIADISNLKRLENLRELLLTETNVNEISPITNLPLRLLDLGGAPVSDFSSISNMNQLRILRLSTADKEDIKFINSLTDLEQLGLYDARVESLYELSGLRHLDSLDLSDVKGLYSLDGIDEFAGVNYFSIAYSDVSDISRLREMPSLSIADLRGIPAKDLSPLVDCRRLKMIYISPDMEPLVSKINLDGVQVLVFD